MSAAQSHSHVAYKKLILEMLRVKWTLLEAREGDWAKGTNLERKKKLWLSAGEWY